MSLVELLEHPAARLLTLALLHFLWQGLAVAVVLVTAVELAKVQTATARYACSLAALFAMLLCPLATVTWLSWPEQSASNISESESVGWAVPTLTDPVVGTAHPTLLALQPLALAAWLAGVSLFGTRLLAGAVGLSRLRHSRQPLPLDLASLVERLGRRLRMDALPVVFLSRRVSEAMAVGLLRPLVLIPAAWLTELPLPMLEAVIAHELAHLRRRDLWVNLLQRLAETLLFYHPAIWWLSRRLRTERELCADELAVAATGRRLEYAQALEQVAHRRQAEVRPALAAFMRGEKNMRVLERVRNVLGLAGGQRSRLWPVGLAALALPVALWAVAASFGSATADEPKDGAKDKAVEAKFFGKADGEKRDEPRRDGDAKKEGARDGEARKDAPRDGEVKKEGARDGEKRVEVRRDGDAKKDAPRDGEPRKVIARDGEPRKEPARDGDARKEPVRDGERRVDVIERKVVTRDGDRPAGDAGQIAELTNMVKRLSAQVDRLQAEVNALRGGKEGVKVEIKEGDKESALRRIKERITDESEAAKKKEGAQKEAAEKEAIRARELKGREGGDKPAAEGARREGGDKPAAEGARREGGDKPAAEGARREGGDKPAAEGARREGGDKPAAEGARREEVRKAVEAKERAVAEQDVARERELIARKRAEAAEAEKRAAAAKDAAKKDKDSK